jgi:hypothetical protein
LFHYRAYELTIASCLELPGLRAVAAGEASADVAISLAAELPDLPDATLTASWWQASSSAFRLDVEGVAIYQAEAGRRLRVQPAPGANPEKVALFLLGSALGALLYQRGLFPLHGSAVASPWGAMVFVGPSGIGKSTLAAHFRQAGYRLLADDVCAIARDAAGVLQVLPAFPHLRLTTDALGRLHGEDEPPPSRFNVDKFVLPLGDGHASSPVALGAVHVLTDVEDGGPALVPLKGFEALQHLADNLYRPAFLQGMRGRGDVLRLAGDIAASAPVYRLDRRRDAARLDALVLWLEHEWQVRFPPAGSKES